MDILNVIKNKVSNYFWKKNYLTKNRNKTKIMFINETKTQQKCPMWSISC